MSSAHSIPVVDLEDYRHGNAQQRDTFIKGVGNALREIGFFALTNHSLSAELIRDSYRHTAELFALADATKLSLEIPGLNGQRGYTSFGKEHAKDSKAPDLKEFWHVGQEISPEHPRHSAYPRNVWPTGLGDFQRVMVDTYRRLESCAFAVLEACSLYIGEEKNLIRDMAIDGDSILRLIHYPPVPTDRDPHSIRAAAHEDINLITLLIEATASGLEILDRHKQWVPVTTPKGCIIVDAGDMLQNLSNGFFKSTTHRVTNPDNSRDRRYSIPFFVHARGEVDLNPIASCVEATGGKALYPKITAHEYLTQRLREIGLA
ncbi:MAG: isopenicillin N synthase family oxygenase [Proteobacteria bacterium]|nr:isopenicillin N synthase family oxygenase [Pseudomonadota bacterium]